LSKDVPFPQAEYDAAVQAEQFARLVSFLDIPDRICGIRVHQLQLGHVFKLEAAGSPFFCGGIPERDDAIKFLWMVSPKHSTSALASWWFRLRHCRRLNTADVIVEIHKFTTEAFADCDGGSGAPVKQFTHAASSMVDLIASEYGWGINEVMRQPIRRAAQFVKCITRRHNPKAVLFNRSERVIADWLRRKDAK
jgi:hypothetical protein